MAFATSPVSARVGRVFDHSNPASGVAVITTLRADTFFDHHFLRKNHFNRFLRPNATRNHDAVGSFGEFHRSCSGLPVFDPGDNLDVSSPWAFRCSRISTTSERLRIKGRRNKSQRPCSQTEDQVLFVFFQPAPQSNRNARQVNAAALFSPRRRCSAPFGTNYFIASMVITDRDHRQPDGVANAQVAGEAFR